jgi:hypothetical protein
MEWKKLTTESTLEDVPSPTLVIVQREDSLLVVLDGPTQAVQAPRPELCARSWQVWQPLN